MATKKTTTTKPKAAPKKKAAATTKTPVKAEKKTTKTAAKKKTTSKPKTVAKVPVKTKAELLVEGVSPDIKAQAVTLANAVLALQEKIEQQIPNYKEADLTQKVIVGTGEEVLRANPLMQEFRATVRDYATALNNLDEMLEKKQQKTGASPVEALRNRFKVG